MKIPLVLTSHDQLGDTSRAVTGQNPASSTTAAKALIELLGARKAA